MVGLESTHALRVLTLTRHLKRMLPEDAVVSVAKNDWFGVEWAVALPVESFSITLSREVVSADLERVKRILATEVEASSLKGAWK